jgi:hypothetical protein
MPSAANRGKGVHLETLFLYVGTYVGTVLYYLLLILTNCKQDLFPFSILVGDAPTSLPDRNFVLGIFGGKRGRVHVGRAYSTPFHRAPTIGFYTYFCDLHLVRAMVGAR